MLDTDKSGKISVAEFKKKKNFFFLIFLLDINHYFVGVLFPRMCGKKCLRMWMKMVIKKYPYRSFRKLLKILARNLKNNNDYFSIKKKFFFSFFYFNKQYQFIEKF